MVIVWIQNLNDIACKVFLFYGFLIISLVKGIQAEALYRLRIPDSQGVDNAVAIADDRHIVRNSLYGLIAFLLENGTAVFIHIRAYPAAEFYLFCILGTAQLKGIAVSQPVVRHFYLITIADLLTEHTVTITDTTAVCRIV